MTAGRRNKKPSKRRGSKDEQTDCSAYVTLDGSETSDSDRQPTPSEPIEGATASNFLEVGKSTGAVPKSLSWAHASTSQAEHPIMTEKSKGHRPLKSDSSPMKTRSQTKKSKSTRKQSKSPFKSGGRALSSRPKSKSPMKGIGRFLSRERTPTEEDPLVDFEDGVRKEEPEKKEAPRELKPDKSKQLKQENLDYYPRNEPDDEVTSQSSISETSSVERATGAMNIDEAADPKAKEPSPEDKEKKGGLKGSVSAHAVLQSKPGPSPKKKDKKK